jgi:hypothetical protein
MSSATLASLVRHLKSTGETSLLYDCDGEIVHIELRPAADQPVMHRPKATTKSLLSRFITHLNTQNATHN